MPEPVEVDVQVQFQLTVETTDNKGTVDVLKHVKSQVFGMIRSLFPDEENLDDAVQVSIVDVREVRAS